MEYGLPGGFVYVDSDVVTVRMETLVNLLLHILQHYVHSLALVISQVKIVGNVPLRNNQRMTRRNGITIVEANTGSRFADDFNISGKIAEMASYSVFPRQFVKVVILIEFITLISDEALVRQFNVALISPLLMNGMQPKALFFFIEHRTR